MRIILFILSLPQPFRYIFIHLLFYGELIFWYMEGKPIPPTKAIKVITILKYAKKYKLSTLIETGTYLGETIEMTKTHFKKIYSVELGKSLYKTAKKNFAGDKHIILFLGDSSQVLPKITGQINTPSLFWLDAHFSDGLTAKGHENTPIMKELLTISKMKVKGSIILMDDARAFTGSSDYPTSKKVKEFIHKKFPNYKMLIRDDVIQIYPSLR